MKIYCACQPEEKREEFLAFAGSPVNPCYIVEYKGEVVMRHYACAVQSMKDRLGCPCECHQQQLAWCSFCPQEFHVEERK